MAIFSRVNGSRLRMKNNSSLQYSDLINKLRHGLIVSCQAYEGDPMFGASHMASMARAAEAGGAAAIRANDVEDIAAIQKAVSLPVIGIIKRTYKDSDVYITPTLHEVEQLCSLGVDMVAIDCTPRKRPGGVSLEELVRHCQNAAVPVFADVSTVEEARYAESLGVAVIAPTLAGYTAYSRSTSGPDWKLIKQITRACTLPLIVEGRVNEPDDAVHALNIGAHAVVVGTAITRPESITARFVEKMKSAEQPESVLGMDLGGTKSLLALVDRNGKLLYSEKRPTIYPIKDEHETIKMLVDWAKGIRAKHPFSRVGLGMAGQVSSVKGELSATLYDDKPLHLPVVHPLTEALDCPVLIDNDSATALLGELWQGGAAWEQHTVMLTIGTGLGAAMWQGDRLLHGSKGAAMEVGHAVLYPQGKLCSCGNQGCAETYISGSALAQNYAEITGKKLKAEEIFELRCQNDPISQEMINDFLMHLGLFLGSLSNLLNPDAIIIGGGVGESLTDADFQVVQNELKKVGLAANQEVVLHRAELGNTAGALGAAWLAY